MSDAPAILFSSPVDSAEDWREAFHRVRPGLPVLTAEDRPDPGRVAYAVVFQPPPAFLPPLTRLRAVFSIAHGMDHMAQCGVPAGVALVQMQDEATADAMADYVTLAALASLRCWPARLADQAARRWRVRYAHPCRTQTACVLGLGMIGARVAARLAANGYRTRAWSRRPRTAGEVPGVELFAGPDRLDAALAGCNVLACVLPLTPSTRGLVDGRRLCLLAPGATLINVSRGGLLNTPDLRRALDDGSLGAVVLDVFDEEPLPEHDPFWTHPAVTVTCHDAGVAPPDEAVAFILDGIDRLEGGQAPRGLVQDRWWERSGTPAKP